MLPEYIEITQDIEKSLEGFFQNNNYSKVAVLVDENTAACCYPIVNQCLPSHTLITIKSGEENKNLNTCTEIWNNLTEQGFDRKSLLINLGGGVIGDMGGFCASTFKRGIAFINLPTTLLSQVDASIGGKLGIDFGVYKNHIGIFKNPSRVIVFSGFLDTLSKRELKSGFAEVIKHCLISDRPYWSEVTSKDFEKQDWDRHIKHSIATKHKIVENDPLEGGIRKILNFGHTLGHAVESYYLNTPEKKLLHGEAIAVGMVCESYLSHTKSGLEKNEMNDLCQYLLKTYGKVEIKPEEIEGICNLLWQDKKNVQNNINASLLTQIGECNFDTPVLINDAQEAIKFYQSYI